MASRLYQYSNYLLPDHYPNTNTNNLSSSSSPHTPTGYVATSADNSDTFPLLTLDDKTVPFDMLPPPMMSSPLLMSTNSPPFPEWTVPTLPPELRRATFHDMYCEYCTDHHHHHHPDGFYCQIPDLMAAAATHVATPEYHYINSHVQVNEEETLPEMKIGKYSPEERKERIVRYLKKRNQRNFTKTIKYECRKTLADKRVRIRGRFAKNNIHEPTSDEEMMMVAEDKKHYESDFVRIKDNNNMMMMKQLQEYGGEDDEIHEFWYQEALASLMYQQQLHPSLSH